MRALRWMGHGTAGRFFNPAHLPFRIKSLEGVRECVLSPTSPSNIGEKRRRSQPVEARQTAPYGDSSDCGRGKDFQMVFVLDRQKHPLMPTTPKRARLLLARGRAVVHRIHPFVIRLKDRRAENSALQDIALKIDPGSKTTGIALARIEQCDSGEVHHAVYLSEISHRGEQVHSNKFTQAQARRRRRSANLRYRPPRFLNRGIREGWLSPSLLSRVLNVVTWTARLTRWSPVRRLEVERVRFDTQLLQNPEIEGTEYQHGTLAGWEARTYLLLKYEYRCVYCSKTDVPFEVDHIRPRSRGGSHRISNLCLACHACNQAKGEKTAAEWAARRSKRGPKLP